MQKAGKLIPTRTRVTAAPLAAFLHARIPWGRELEAAALFTCARLMRGMNCATVRKVREGRTKAHKTGCHFSWPIMKIATGRSILWLCVVFGYGDEWPLSCAVNAELIGLTLLLGLSKFPLPAQSSKYAATERELCQPHTQYSFIHVYKFRSILRARVRISLSASSAIRKG